LVSTYPETTHWYGTGAGLAHACPGEATITAQVVTICQVTAVIIHLRTGAPHPNNSLLFLQTIHVTVQPRNSETQQTS